MQPIDVIRIMKQEWGPKQACTDMYGQDAKGRSTDVGHAVKHCGNGKIAQITGCFEEPTVGLIMSELGIKVQSMLADKLVEQGLQVRNPMPDPETIIMGVNDSDDGYEKITRAIDALLMEHQSVPVGGVVKRELVGV